MLTIFSNPRPFKGEFDVLQRNAIRSWLKLGPQCEIILFEDEEKTTSKVAGELAVKCITDVRCDEFGTPLLDDVFSKVKAIAKNDIIVQVNSDIILFDDFLIGVELVKKIIGEKPFFMSGQRWNLKIENPILFNESDWQKKLKDLALKEGKLHRLSGMDYWMFPRNFQFNPLPFIIGRPGMDSWLIYKSKSLKIPVIDATGVIMIIHQNHGYPRRKDYFFKIEKQRNIKLAGGLVNMSTLREADWILTSEGLKRPPFPRRIFSILSLFYPWRLILAFKRRLFS
jgi:hypothetical protein